MQLSQEGLSLIGWVNAAGIMEMVTEYKPLSRPPVIRIKVSASNPGRSGVVVPFKRIEHRLSPRR